MIPTIEVDTRLVHLGLNPDGSPEVPSSFDLAGWYDGSATPGEPGKPTVILGHVDSSSGPAVFFRLRNLGPGDDIWVKRQDRVWVRFVVDRVAQVPKSEFPTIPVYGPNEGVTLRLVTCGGAFDSSIGHYVDNVIAYATLAA